MKNKLIFCLLLVALGCNKKGSEPLHFTIKQELIDYYNWQKGSYWVFVDSLTGKRDSITVMGYGMTSHVTSDRQTTDELNIYMYDFYDTIRSPSLWRISLFAIDNGAYLTYFNGSDYNKSDFVYYDINPFMLPTSNSLISNTTIGTKDYINVLKCQGPKGSALSDIVLLNAENGFIKISLNNKFTSKILLLQDNHIVK